MSSQDHPVGQPFWGVFKVQDPQAPACRNAQIWDAKKLEFPEIAQNHDCGALWFCLGLLIIRILCFLKEDKNNGVFNLETNLFFFVN